MILHIFKVLFTAVGDFVVVLIFHIVLQKKWFSKSEINTNKQKNTKLPLVACL